MFLYWTALCPDSGRGKVSLKDCFYCFEFARVFLKSNVTADARCCCRRSATGTGLSWTPRDWKDNEYIAWGEYVRRPMRVEDALQPRFWNPLSSGQVNILSFSSTGFNLSSSVLPRLSVPFCMMASCADANTKASYTVRTMCLRCNKSLATRWLRAAYTWVVHISDPVRIQRSCSWQGTYKLGWTEKVHYLCIAIIGTNDCHWWTTGSSSDFR